MDWSEILTQSEAEFTREVLEHLGFVPWAEALVQEIGRRGGLTFKNKPLLFEARVAYAIAKSGIIAVEYEYCAGVGDSSIDFRLGTEPEWLVEVVSIARSDAVKEATFHSGSYFETILASPNSSQSVHERNQSEEGEALLVVQKIGEKVYDGVAPIKVPAPLPGKYHIVVVDMRGHLGGGDIMDWRQIAYGAEAVPMQYRKYWLDKNNKQIPLRGVWHPDNPMRFSPTARERLHAIMFIAEERYVEGELSQGAWIACNPHLFVDEAAARGVLNSFPLRCPVKEIEVKFNGSLSCA